MARAHGTVRYGTSGWDHADWAGLAYPRGRDVDRFAHVARLVHVLELASTYESWPGETAVERWARWGHFAGLTFVALAPRALTHERGGPDPRLAARFRATLAPLVEAGVLSAALLQFPQGLHWERATAALVREAVDLVAPLHAVVELRHRSWNRDLVRSWLTRHGVGFCNIDQPQLPGAMPPTAWFTASPAMVRLHGRHRAAWFARDVGNGRHAYRYTADELRPWADAIRRLSGEARETHVVATNHAGGHALATVLKLRALAGERGLAAPEPLLALDPELGELGVSAADPDTGP